MANHENIITEIKRLIALNFINNEKYFEEYKKYSCYKIEKNKDNFIVINIDGKQYTLEEILSYLIKQIIENGKNKSIIIKKKNCIRGSFMLWNPRKNID
jgi:molecular chaperone DnaK (HSP70)